MIQLCVCKLQDILFRVLSVSLPFTRKIENFHLIFYISSVLSLLCDFCFILQ